MTVFLFYIKHQSLEVFTLWMIDVDWMVGRLMKLMQNAHLALCLSCCCEHGCTELLFIYSLRTTEREEDTSLTNTLETFVIQTSVTL